MLLTHSTRAENADLHYILIAFCGGAGITPCIRCMRCMRKGERSTWRQSPSWFHRLHSLSRPAFSQQHLICSLRHFHFKQDTDSQKSFLVLALLLHCLTRGSYDPQCLLISNVSRAVAAVLSITKATTAAQHCAEQQGCGVQGRNDAHGKAGLQQHFADMAFFSRARTTGKMGEVVDKLKANLRYAIYLTWVTVLGRPCHVAWQVNTLALSCN